MQEFDLAYLLQTYGYIALLVGTFLEGETIVLLAGLFAQQGHLLPVPAILCAFTGSLVSDQLMFCLGRWKGNAILRRFPRLEKRAPKVRAWLGRYETALILGFRFIYGVRNVTPLLLGMSTVNRWKFFFLNIVSAAVWATSFVATGYFFGQALTRVLAAHPHAQKLALVAVIVLAAGAWLWRRVRKVSSVPPSV